MYKAATMGGQRVSFIGILVLLKRSATSPASCALMSVLVSSRNPYRYLSWLTARNLGRGCHVLVKETRFTKQVCDGARQQNGQAYRVCTCPCACHGTCGGLSREAHRPTKSIETTA